MDLKALQEKYRKGEITKDEYLKRLKELLDGEDIDQAAYDEAKDFDPGDPEDKPVYSQKDVDRMIVKKALGLVRRTLKDAGVEIDATNKELLAKVTDLVKAGEGKEPPKDSDLQKQLTEATKKLAKLEPAANRVHDLELENEVLKMSGEFKPVDPSGKQVVRAILADYKDLIEYDDETGALDRKSVKKAVKRVTENEKNLFQNPEGDDEGQGNNNEPGFKGKGPGGAAGGDKNKNKTAADTKEALALMGIKKEN